MTLCFPAYFNDRSRKRDVLVRVENTEWSNLSDLERWLPAERGIGSSSGGALYRLTGFPADVTLIAQSILRHLPADRRGRFMAAFFEAPDAGADLAPVAARFLATLAQIVPPRTRPPVGECLTVKEHPVALESIMAQPHALVSGTGWMTCADLLIEVLCATELPG